MRHIIFALLLALLLPSVALAQTPTPESAPVIDGLDIQVYDYQNSGTQIDLSPINNIFDIDLINNFGSAVATLLEITIQTNVVGGLGPIGILAVLTISMVVIRWMFSQATKMPPSDPGPIDKTTDDIEDPDMPSYSYPYNQPGDNPYRIYSSADGRAIQIYRD